MRYCIVNADDFGAGHGVNLGIVEAHERGVVTSTSLMVNMPGTLEAVELARGLPDLSVGLHVNLTNEGDAPVVALDDLAAARAEIVGQWRRFEALTGAAPTHLDAHHNIHRNPQLRDCFAELAQEAGVPLRENCEVRYFGNFYGQWDGETHLEQISVDNLLAMLEAELADGFTELSCHPGRMSDDFQSGYGAEREAELQTLCDPRIAQRFAEPDIRLINYRDFAALRGPAKG